MPPDDPIKFSSWEDLYKERSVESMPWFNPALDNDLQNALDEGGLQGGAALDIGTGPGTQAIQLARRNFKVTATDLSGEAIRLARERMAADPELAVAWKQDDILDTRLDRQFDLIFDRGCFHVLDPGRRQDYVKTIHDLLLPGGYFFLKCFSHLQPGKWGPHRFTPEQIREIFGNTLPVISIRETIYRGTLETQPKALFCIMKR